MLIIILLKPMQPKKKQGVGQNKNFGKWLHHFSCAPDTKIARIQSLRDSDLLNV